MVAILHVANVRRRKRLAERNDVCDVDGEFAAAGVRCPPFNTDEITDVEVFDEEPCFGAMVVAPKPDLNPFVFLPEVAEPNPTDFAPTNKSAGKSKAGTIDLFHVGVDVKEGRHVRHVGVRMPTCGRKEVETRALKSDPIFHTC